MTIFLRGMALLLVFQLAGETFVAWLEMPIPGNVLGMVLLLLAMLAGIVKAEWVEETAELLLNHLALFFVPAGVGVMVYLDLIGRQWLPITIAMVLSTFVVLAVTGWVEQRLETGAEEDNVE